MDENLSQLGTDIRLLGTLLGEIIREQHGDRAFDLVERVRAQARSRREHATDAAQTLALAATIDALTLDEHRVLIKAFSNYFQLINIAEDQQRVRVLRQREAAGGLGESLDAAMCSLHAAGVTAATMRDILDRLQVRLVLTAHPSEAKRTEVLRKLHTISAMMTSRERQRLLPREQAMLQARLKTIIEALWQTPSTRTTHKTVADEVDFGLYFLTSVIIDVTLDVYEDLEASLRTYYPEADWSALPTVLRYGSWIGGDRDGNPNVTSDVNRSRCASNGRLAFSDSPLRQEQSPVAIRAAKVCFVIGASAPPAIASSAPPDRIISADPTLVSPLAARRGDPPRGGHPRLARRCLPAPRSYADPRSAA